ncbi:MAG: hypothetical protein JKY22_10490 [Flavobacteriaceae bacterium]|nr:hypothetical protein [Flavobacteriaceae bacterium]
MRTYILILIQVFWFCCFTSCNYNRNEKSNNMQENIDFSIEREEVSNQFKKSNIEIRLKEEISIGELKQIAIGLKSERENLDKIWIFYYLPEHNKENGAWAITHFKPELEAKILGATRESSENLLKEHVTGQILAIWKDNDAMLPNRIFLVRENGLLFMKTVYAESELAGNGGELIENVTEIKMNGVTRYDYKNAHGEYCLVEKNGNLGLYDESGKFKEAIIEN